MTVRTQPALVVHVIHRLAVGGLENGLVNVINRMPPDQYRHVIVCLTDFTSFRSRIKRADVPVIALHKPDRPDWGTYWRLWKLFRDLKPDIVHTRTFGTLDTHFSSWLAGVKGRVHGEHGQHSASKKSWRHRIIRRLTRPLVHHFTAVSRDLADWLLQTGVCPERLTQIYNGVDVERFHPSNERGRVTGAGSFFEKNRFVIGTVGRMQPVKDQLTLVCAFLSFLATIGAERASCCRLVIVGDGPLRQACLDLVRSAKAGDLVWMPGDRDDIPDILRELDLFVLPSVSEGTSNTILEAMATGLPIIASRVGGNPELVTDGKTGTLIPPSDPAALTDAIRSYWLDRDKLLRHGQAARQEAESRFSMEAMLHGYKTVYDSVLG